MVIVSSALIILCHRGGVYPASACLKISGVDGECMTSLQHDNMTIFMTEAGYNLTIRGCAVDSGTLTADTEMVRLSHCGSFVLDTRCSTV